MADRAGIWDVRARGYDERLGEHSSVVDRLKLPNYLPLTVIVSKLGELHHRYLPPAGPSCTICLSKCTPTTARMQTVLRC